jgi:2-C-methyl-D-erythritol 4-phosphate cytidylyltransferase
MGKEIPKQFLHLGPATILEYTIRAFDTHPAIDEIVVVTGAAEMRRVALLMVGAKLQKSWSVVTGGATRQESVWQGLHGFDLPPGIVLIHDAVRPLVSRRCIDETIAATTRYGAAVVGVRVKDTVKREGKPGYYTRTLDREKLWGVQTPQGFTYHLILEAHRAARRAHYRGTDDASLLERRGIPVKIVEGEYQNLKITSPEDLLVAWTFLPRVRSKDGKHRKS